jgi:hypothetical protein
MDAYIYDDLYEEKRITKESSRDETTFRLYVCLPLS